MPPQLSGVRHTLKKREVLKSKQQIKELFDRGSTFFLYPYKVFFKFVPEVSSPANFLISVSKKNFRRAVDRNIIRRRIRESYRLNKHLLIRELSKGTSISAAYIYIGKSILPFEEINNKLKEVLLRLINVEVHKTDNKHE